MTYVKTVQMPKDAFGFFTSQTIYAKNKGSVAAPTAGFHFDEDLLGLLREKHIEMEYLTLHIGAGTFTPVRVNKIQEHKMHTE